VPSQVPVVAVRVAAPAIAGTLADGATLTATTGTWDGTPPISYGYRWQRCDADGASCQDVAGATDGTYALGRDDVDARMRVVVTATNAAGSAARASSATAAIAATAPVNTAPPAISGAERDGQLLTSARGTWTGTTPLTYAYQWQRCDADRASCTDIAGATRSTYTLTSPDAGHAVRVRVTATNTAGSTAEISGPTGAVVAAAPVVAAPPAVTGARVDGSVLTVDPGSWGGTTPIAYAYQWQRCDDGNGCGDIAGATAATYALTAADVDHAIRAIVTATNAAGSADTASAAVGPIDPSAPDSLAAPAISGTTTDLATLTATTGTWTGTPPISYGYRWQRCDADGNDCLDIDGATGGTYTLTDDDVDHTIRVAVTARNAGGSASRVSAATGAIAAAAPVSTAAPAIAGATRDGQLLTSNRGTWTGTAPIAYAYQWQRCDAARASCTDIAAATRSTYTLTSADTDHAVRLVVTATNAAGAASAISDPSDPVAAVAPFLATPPAITGTRVDGQVLTVDHGAWSGTTPIAYAYQWQRCDDGDGCDDIAGATSTTYALTAADVDHAIRAIVTATNAAGSASTASSAVGPIDAARPANVAAPALSGSAIDGATLTANDGSWTGTAPIAVAHQWQRCDGAGTGCADIDGATSSSYTLTSADVGRTLRDRVKIGRAHV